MPFNVPSTDSPLSGGTNPVGGNGWGQLVQGTTQLLNTYASQGTQPGSGLVAGLTSAGNQASSGNLVGAGITAVSTVWNAIFGPGAGPGGGGHVQVNGNIYSRPDAFNTSDSPAFDVDRDVDRSNLNMDRRTAYLNLIQQLGHQHGIYAEDVRDAIKWDYQNHNVDIQDAIWYWNGYDKGLDTGHVSWALTSWFTLHPELRRAYQSPPVPASPAATPSPSPLSSGVAGGGGGTPPLAQGFDVDGKSLGDFVHDAWDGAVNGAYNVFSQTNTGQNVQNQGARAWAKDHAIALTLGAVAIGGLIITLIVTLFGGRKRK